MHLNVTGDGVADTLGLDGVYEDPVWRRRVELTPLERDLLRCWWVRRLALVAHAGAAALTSTQTYSRLEHSLGLLTMVAALAPDDELGRVAALLHDVGHLPLSHTVEGVAGLDHHRLGRERIAELSPVLAEHGLDAGEVADAADGLRPTALRGPTAALRLDHLESWVRGGHAHGRTREPPEDTLGRLRLRDGAVDTDEATAAYVVGLAIGEARWRTSAANVVATGLVRRLGATLLADLHGDDLARVAATTDAEFWALLLTHPRTGATARAFLRDPGAWSATPLAPGSRDDVTAGEPGDDAGGDAGGDAEFEFDVGRLYLDLPLVDGELHPHGPEALAPVAALPRRFAIRREASRPDA